MPRTPDPYGAFNFLVLIDGTEAGGFSEVTSVQAETEVEDYREGGINDFLHKIVKVTKYPAVTLKRGITDATAMWDWHQQVISGKIEAKEITIVLRDIAGKEKKRWILERAYPVKWSGADLNAASGNVAVESVEMVYHGLK